ncbi:unnamed protein product [Vicia faba]|uniref:Uncharacterized protein n=1 Tax=Vicia faba TaxID=3906 RepID=A0AAV0Z7U8_VICFA|nr:unnamed protein product [Vicia faba]
MTVIDCYPYFSVIDQNRGFPFIDRNFYFSFTVGNLCFNVLFVGNRCFNFRISYFTIRNRSRISQNLILEILVAESLSDLRYEELDGVKGVVTINFTLHLCEEELKHKVSFRDVYTRVHKKKKKYGEYVSQRLSRDVNGYPWGWII